MELTLVLFQESHMVPRALTGVIPDTPNIIFRNKRKWGSQYLFSWEPCPITPAEPETSSTPYEVQKGGFSPSPPNPPCHPSFCIMSEAQWGTCVFSCLCLWASLYLFIYFAVLVFCNDVVGPRLRTTFCGRTDVKSYFRLFSSPPPPNLPASTYAFLGLLSCSVLTGQIIVLP